MSARYRPETSPRDPLAGVEMRTVAVGEPAPAPMVISLVVHSGQVHVQWPPQMPPEAVLQSLAAAHSAIADGLRERDGGLILARG